MGDERIVVRRPVGPPPFALRVAAVLVVPLLLYALVATGQKAIDKYRLNQEAERLRAEVVSLRAENIQLQQSLEDARTDVAIETIAREQLGLIKPGDHPIVMVGQPAVQSAAAPWEGFEAGLMTGPTRQETLAGILRRESEEIERLRADLEQAMNRPLSAENPSNISRRSRQSIHHCSICAFRTDSDLCSSSALR